MTMAEATNRCGKKNSPARSVINPNMSNMSGDNRVRNCDCNGSTVQNNTYFRPEYNQLANSPKNKGPKG